MSHYFPPLLAEESGSLLSKYQNFHPFYESLRDYMPARKCNSSGDDCNWKITLEDNPLKFERLLEQTEQQHNVDDKSFLTSPLGQNYQSLKGFMNIREKFQACQEKAEILTGDYLNENLQRILANTSTLYLENPCPSPKANTVLSEEQIDFAEDFVEFQLEKELVSDSIERSLEAKIFFRKKFNNEDIESPSFQEQLLTNLCLEKAEENACNEEELDYLRALIQKKIHKVSKNIGTPSMSAEKLANGLNSHITQVNGILKGYNQKKKELEEQWKEKNRIEKLKASSHSPLESRRKKKAEFKSWNYLQEELVRLKKVAFDEYQSAYSTHTNREVGAILQTEAIKNFSKIRRLEQRDAKWLGIAGFEYTVLQNEDSFPLLSMINTKAARKAIDESLAKTKAQVKELLQRRRKSGSQKERRENLIYLFTVNPTSTGHVLINNPKYSNTICKIAQDMASRKRNQKVLVQGGFIALGIGAGVAGFFTAGTSTSLAVILASALGGMVYTISESLYLRNEVKRRRRLQADILNAYLAGLGDKQSVEDVRENWQSILENNHYISMAPWFLLADATGVAAAAKGMNLIKMGKLIKILGPGSKINAPFLSLLSKNDIHIKAVTKLINQRSKEIAGQFLNFVGKLPPPKQFELMKNFSESPNLSTFINLSETKAALTKNQFTSLRKILSKNKRTSTRKVLREIISSKGLEKKKAQMFYNTLAGGNKKRVIRITPRIKDLISKIPKERFNQSPLSAKILGLTIRHLNDLGDITPKDVSKILKFIKTWDDQSLSGLGKIYADSIKLMGKDKSLLRNDALLLAMKSSGISSRVINGVKKCVLF